MLEGLEPRQPWATRLTPLKKVVLAWARTGKRYHYHEYDHYPEYDH